MSNRITTDQIRAMKGREKIAALTAYDICKSSLVYPYPSPLDTVREGVARVDV